MIETLDTIIYSLLALLPGYLMDSLIRIKIPLGKRDINSSIFRFILLSIVNYLPWLWVVIPNLVLRDFSTTPLRDIDIYFLFAILFISPVIISILFTKFKKFKILNSLLVRIGFSLDTMIPDAWDYVFIKQPTCFMSIVLKSGYTVLGYYGDNSYISAGCEGKTLYLEKVYSIDEISGEWRERENSDGIIVCGEEVSYLELFK